MNNRVKFAYLAQKELEHSYDWYEERSIGLGSRFADSIMATIAKILKNPDSYPRKKHNNREIQVDKFPFIIVYSYDEVTDIIQILRVFHTKRNPKLK